MKNTLLDTLYDALVWVFQVFIGVAAKLSLESRKRKITFKYVLTSFIIACFVGYIIDKVWTSKGWIDTRGVAVAVAALLSESIIRYINDNLPSILNLLIKKKLDVDLKKEQENENLS